MDYADCGRTVCTVATKKEKVPINICECTALSSRRQNVGTCKRLRWSLWAEAFVLLFVLWEMEWKRTGNCSGLTLAISYNSRTRQRGGN